MEMYKYGVYYNVSTLLQIKLFLKVFSGSYLVSVLE